MGLLWLSRGMWWPAPPPAQLILVLGGDPVLRDGPNEVTGDRIVVYLDEGRSVVESGGKKRVSAVLYPGSERGLGETAGKPAEKPSATGKKR